MYVIIINGKGGSGKDTIVNYIDHITPWSNIYNATSIQLVTKAAKILGWNGEKTKKDRKFLADLKQLSIDYNNQPTEMLVSEIYNAMSKSEEEDIIFCHVREPEEIKKLKLAIEKLDIKVYNWLIKSNIENKYGNSSDDNVYDYTYDYILLNNFVSFDDTKIEVKRVLSEMGIPYESEHTAKSYSRSRKK